MRGPCSTPSGPLQRPHLSSLSLRPTFISARLGGDTLASSTLISPGGILFRHCSMIRRDWRISSTRHRYLKWADLDHGEAHRGVSTSVDGSPLGDLKLFRKWSSVSPGTASLLGVAAHMNPAVLDPAVKSFSSHLFFQKAACTFPSSPSHTVWTAE